VREDGPEGGMGRQGKVGRERNRAERRKGRERERENWRVFFKLFSNFANFTQTNINPLCNQKMTHKLLLLLKLFKMIFK
jgi:hypothetical protein